MTHISKHDIILHNNFIIRRIGEMDSVSKISYEIPAHGIFDAGSLRRLEKTRSKYFDLRKDTQAGLHLGNMDEMQQEYLDQVCGGIPWDNDKS